MELCVPLWLKTSRLPQVFRDTGFTRRARGAYAAPVNENMKVLHTVPGGRFHPLHASLLVMGVFSGDRIHWASLCAFETFDALVVETVGVDVLLSFVSGA